MPTASERAAFEAERWLGLVDRWSPASVPYLFDDVAPDELSVVVFYDPAEDLEHRATGWEFDLRRPHLDELARFSATLADAEASSWLNEVPDLAMRAYESRRLLLTDRIAHWAVPWLDAVGRWYPDHADSAVADRDTILELGDDMRIAPALTGTEGLVVPGEDSYGPISADVPLRRIMRSLWSGEVLPGGAVDSAGSEEYLAAADRWRSIAAAHPGSARLWLDLADRAGRTARSLQ